MATIPFRGTRPGARRTGAVRGPLVAVLAVLLVLLGVTAPRLVGRVRDALAAASPDPAGQAEHWVTQNLPVDARLVTDTTEAGRLSAAGVPAWDMIDFRALDQMRATALAGSWATYDFVLSTPALRAGMSGTGQTRKALAGSVVVASYGAGAGRVEVREIAPDGAPALAAQQARQQAASRAAGAQLLTSAGVHLSPQAAEQALSGTVDGRLLSDLVGLGAQHTLTVGTFTDPDPGGLFGNRLRQVSVLVVDGALVEPGSPQVLGVLDWLAAQSGPFRPSAVAVHGSQLLIRFRVPGPRDASVL